MIDYDKVYERVYSVSPIDRNDFNDDAASALREIVALCGKKYVYADGTGDSDEVYEEYEPALCAEILFYMSGDKYDRECFLMRVKEAFCEIWRRKAALAKKREGGNA